MTVDRADWRTYVNPALALGGCSDQLEHIPPRDVFPLPAAVDFPAPVTPNSSITDPEPPIEVNPALTAKESQVITDDPAPDSSLGGAAELLALVVESRPDGKHRAEQVAMTAAVSKAFSYGGHLVVQAGTGTGKSIAYLVPAIYTAVGLGQGPVVVATNTIMLQNQLIGDLPGLVEVLAEPLGRAPTYALLKGRSNYLCRHKASREAARIDRARSIAKDKNRGGPNLEEVDPGVEVVEGWATSAGCSGDRDDLPLGVSDDVWGKFSVSSSECIGATKCDFAKSNNCFSESARARAAEVDIVVINHASLATELLNNFAVPVVPPHTVRVVDEAHELSRVFTDALTARLSETSLFSTWQLTQRIDDSASFGLFKQAVDEFADAFRNVQSDARGDDYDVVEIARLVPATADEIKRHAGQRRRVDELSMSDLVSKLGSAARLSIKNAEGGDPVDRAKVISALTEVEKTTERILKSFAVQPASDRADVVWLEHFIGRNGKVHPTLGIQPLSVADNLRDRLFGTATTVMASATLMVNKSFDSVARDWGLNDTAATFLDVGTPFNYESDAVLYRADLKAPKYVGKNALDSKVLEEMEPRLKEMQELIEASGGRALVLFASKRAARLAAEQMNTRLETQVLCQGEDDESLPELIERFKNTPATSLFGYSLWEGIDVPDLPLVIIERVPFASGDPLLEARKRAVMAQRGEDASFYEVIVDPVAVKLNQGAGRLLRRVGNRGVIAILDSRAERKTYANYLIRSLPPFRRCRDGGAVREALRNLVSGSDDPFGHIPRTYMVAPAKPVKVSATDSSPTPSPRSGR